MPRALAPFQGAVRWGRFQGLNRWLSPGVLSGHETVQIANLVNSRERTSVTPSDGARVVFARIVLIFPVVCLGLDGLAQK